MQFLLAEFWVQMSPTPRFIIIMDQSQRQQGLRKCLAHLFSVSGDQFPKLLEFYVKSAQEYARHRDQSSFIKLIKGEFVRCRGGKARELIRVIRILDSVLKEEKSYREQVAQVIAQIFVQLFSIFNEKNLQGQIEELKMMRKSWATLLPDDLLERIQTQVIAKFNYNLDRGFSKTKITQLIEYYTKKIKLPPEIYNKYLPSSDNTKTSDLDHYAAEQGEEPSRRNLPPDTREARFLPNQTFPRGSVAPYQQQQQQQQQQSSYPPNNYMYPVQMQYTTQMPVPMNQHPRSQMQQMSQMPQISPMSQMPQMSQISQMSQMSQMNNNYYYPPPVSGVSMNSAAVSAPGSYYYNQMPLYPSNVNNMQPYKASTSYLPASYPDAQHKRKEQAKRAKEEVHPKYKQLLGFGKYRCPSCGLLSNRRDCFDIHLKSHFQSLKLDYDLQRNNAPTRRHSSLDIHEWLPHKHNTQQASFFLDSQKSPDKACRLCSEPFEPQWDSKLEKWVFKETVIVQLSPRSQCSMHSYCFATLNKDAEMEIQ